MTAVFADSSALAELYADEADAELVRSLFPLVVSQLAPVEVPAALWRKHRTGEVSAADAALLVEAFEADYFGTQDDPERFLVLAVSATILDSAAQLAGIHGAPSVRCGPVGKCVLRARGGARRGAICGVR